MLVQNRYAKIPGVEPHLKQEEASFAALNSVCRDIIERENKLLSKWLTIQERLDLITPVLGDKAFWHVIDWTEFKLLQPVYVSYEQP